MRRLGAYSQTVTLLCILISLEGCSLGPSPSNDPEAYVAPAELPLRSSLSSKGAVVTRLHHGDRVVVLEAKRHYLRVRARQGEGWLDARQLLTKEQMAAFRQATAQYLSLPSQGRATTFDLLNVHIDPDRRAPSFTQIAGNVSVDVLAHKSVPRVTRSEPYKLPEFLRPDPAVRPAKKPRSTKALSLRPPRPAPPKPPANWQALSSERLGGPTRADLEKEKKAAADAALKKAQEEEKSKPVILEDWDLIRTADRKVGWVLARSLYMAIPDEVAQYAEGQRITSYFELGTVQDEEKGTKHHWLWTTASKSGDFDFDRFRIFYWNRRRHRYETSYRQANIIGYFPVEVEKGNGGPPLHFSLILQSQSGGLDKRQYVFDGTLVHLVSTEPYAAADTGPTKAPAPSAAATTKAAPRPNWWVQQWNKIKARFHR